MRARPSSPAQCVSLLQVLLARELAERIGLPGTRVAEILNVAPSAVSQYLRGTRRAGLLEAVSTDTALQGVVRNLAESLAETPPGRPGAVRAILDAAASLYEDWNGPGTTSAPTGLDPRTRREFVRALHDRVAIEQAAVADCMQLAQKARDELTRALFRQIASDSLRHAEIATSLAAYLERGVHQSRASGISRADVRRLLRHESQAERESTIVLERSLGGMMALLAASMGADEEKHTRLLTALLEPGVVWSDGSRGRRRGRPLRR